MHNESLEFGAFFCANADCVLHVRVGDPGVRGCGQWATLADGSIVGRGLYDGRLQCDRCGLRRELSRVRWQDEHPRAAS